jgi:hypothetical protein
MIYNETVHTKASKNKKSIFPFFDPIISETIAWHLKGAAK